MKKVIMLILLSLILCTFRDTAAQNSKDLELWSTIPESFQGSYRSYLVSVKGDAYRSASVVFAVAKSNTVEHSGNVYKPTAIYMLSQNTITLFFADINRYWRISKTGLNSCTVVVEDTKAQIELMCILAYIE